MKMIMWLALVVGLSGCSVFKPLRTDLSAKAVPTNTTELALTNTLLQAFESVPASAAGCTGDQSRKGKNTDDRRQCIVFKKTPSDRAELHRFIDAGFALSNIYCEDFFRETNASARRRKFARSTTSDVGATIKIILGLANVASGVGGGFAAAFGFTDAGFRNYDESYLVAADLSRVRKLVLATQDHFKASLNDEATDKTTHIKDYIEARDAIVRYDAICSYLGMQELINASVSDQTDQIKSIDSKTQVTTASAGTADAANIGGRLKPPTGKLGINKSQEAGAGQGSEPAAAVAPPVTLNEPDRQGDGSGRSTGIDEPSNRDRKSGDNVEPSPR